MRLFREVKIEELNAEIEKGRNKIANNYLKENKEAFILKFNEEDYGATRKLAQAEMRAEDYYLVDALIKMVEGKKLMESGEKIYTALNLVDIR